MRFNHLNIKPKPKNIMKTQYKKLDIAFAKKIQAAFELPRLADIVQRSFDHYGLPVFEFDGCEYAVAETDDAAQGAAERAIADSLWAFNASFIISECNLPAELEDGLKAAQEKQFESANEWLLPMVKRLVGISDFAASAISADGRGHFLSPYDGEEIEKNGLYFYRLN